MYYFIVNPVSSSGNGRSVWEKTEQLLKKEKIPYKAFLLTQPREAAMIAARLSQKFAPCTIVAIGGDGTINEVINGIRNYDEVTFACIPSGSGNDFIRGMGLPRSPEAMLRCVLNPRHFRSVNVGKVTADGKSRRFIVSAGIGFDAAVCHRAQNSRLKVLLNYFRSGKLVYTLMALWLLLSMKRQPLRIIVDGKQLITCRRAYFASIMNLPYEGGGFKFCPDAKPGDGLLDLCIADDFSRPRALCVLPLAFFGKHAGKRGISLLQCRRVTIQNPEPLCVHTDGEIFGFCTKITVRLLPKKLRVIVG